jgi:hypothetical protein
MTTIIHVIKQQRLHVEVNGAESDAWLLQNRLTEWCHNDLLFALEKVFNQFTTSDYWSIDRLDIDAGVLSLESLEQDLTAVVTQAIEKELREQILNSPSSTITTENIRHKTSQQNLTEALVYFLNSGRLPWSVQLAKNKSFEQILLDAWQNAEASIHAELIINALSFAPARKRLVKQFSPLFMSALLAQFSSEGKKVIANILPILQNTDSPPTPVKQFEQQLWETLFTFVATGKAFTETAIIAEAWHTLDISKTQALENSLLDAWHNTASINTPPAIIISLLNSETARKRIVSQFSPSLMTNLLAQISLESQKVIETILTILQNSDARPVAVNQFEQQLWETVFSFIAKGKIVTENAVIAEAWQALAVKTPALENVLGRYWSLAITNTHSPKLKPQSSVSVIEAADVDVINDFTIDYEQDNLQITDSVKPPKKTDTHKPPDTQKNLPTKSVLETADIQEGIYIENAGLILLHPFLPQFFTALGIAEENQLIQAERALCLLHFLTTGLKIAPEYELTLVKILCNIPLDTPVESDMELTESEIEEAEALLNAVIRHWEALRNTSIDGLRGEFLFRFGKLSMRDDGDWLLQVENKTADILLNQLPWGLSMIKLPWMQQMLWVEWNY